jgi:hypothetical protein
MPYQDHMSRHVPDNSTYLNKIPKICDRNPNPHTLYRNNLSLADLPPCCHSCADGAPRGLARREFTRLKFIRSFEFQQLFRWHPLNMAIVERMVTRGPYLTSYLSFLY